MRSITLAFLLGLVCMNGCALLVLPGLDLPSGPLSQEIVEPAEWAMLPPFPKKILLLDIDGVITDSSSKSLLHNQENTVESIKEKLNAAKKDPMIAAIVLRINSPGGGVTASDLIYNEIIQFKQATKKPVVACFMSVGASGGYYIASAADVIVANPTSITGSIGVVAHTLHVNGLFDKLGLRSETIKSGEMKDIGSPFRSFTPEERALFQGVIDQLFDRFVSVVRKGRPAMNGEQLAKIADGRIFTAQQALETGLVDRVGYLQDAIAIAKERAKVKKAHVVVYRKPFSYRGNIYARFMEPAGGDVNLLKLDANALGLEDRGPVFLYLWEP